MTGWTRSRSLWVRRAAAVALIPMARRGQALDVAYDVAARLLDDEEDLIHKATGWLLREAGKTAASSRVGHPSSTGVVRSARTVRSDRARKRSRSSALTTWLPLAAVTVIALRPAAADLADAASVERDLRSCPVHTRNRRPRSAGSPSWSSDPDPHDGLGAASARITTTRSVQGLQRMTRTWHLPSGSPARALDTPNWRDSTACRSICRRFLVSIVVSCRLSSADSLTTSREHG